MDISEIKHFFFDLDKTVWNWNEPVIEADKTIRNLKERGKRVKFYTDNTLLTREEYAKKLTKMNIPAEKEDILTSGYVTGRMLAKKNKNKVYTIGEQSLIRELEEHDIEVTKNTNTLVNGFDRKFNYQTLKQAKKILDTNGSQLINCSRERVFRNTKEKKPHQEPMNRALSTYATNTKLTGKPGKRFRETFRNYFTYLPEKSLLVGDNLDDIQIGNELGIKTGIVMSGDTDKEELKKAEENRKPDIGLNSLTRLQKKLL